MIDLLSSSDEEDNNDEEVGEISVSSILREHYPEMLASQSQEIQLRNGCDSLPKNQMNQNKSDDQYTNHDNASDSVVDDEIESFDHYELRSLGFLRNHCWACHVWIDHPGFESDENKDEICYNALHLHPILGVPTCVVCAETIEAVERKRRLGRIFFDKEEGQSINRTLSRTIEDDGEDNSMACNACGKLEDFEGEHIRCDACTRAICPNCFEQAHHFIGGSDGKVLSSSRKGPRPTSIQKCFCCSCLEIDSADDDSNDKVSNNSAQKDKINDQNYLNIPPFLQKLRRLTQKLFSSSNGKTKQSIEDIIEELDMLEAEKQLCESHLDDPTHLLKEIGEELSEELDMDEADIKEDDIFEIRVQHRYQECYEEWTHHQTRLMDRITILGDRLKAEYGIETVAALRYIEASNKVCETDEQDSSEIEYKEAEPLYKVAADYELLKRDRDERLKRKKEVKRFAQKRGDDPKYLLEITEDAEDLGSSDEVDTSNGSDVSDDENVDAYDNGWRNAPFKARKKDIEVALRAEDARRIEEGKNTLICSSKNHDMEEIVKWDSGLKSSAMIVKKKSKKRKRLPTRTVSLPDGMSPLRATTASTLRGRKKHVDKENIGGGNRNVAAFGEPLDNTNINMMVGKPKALERSTFVLSTNPFICIAREFERHLKEHQKEGIKFMYKSTFADLGKDKEANIGGCILAHSMGLGKFL